MTTQETRSELGEKYVKDFGNNIAFQLKPSNDTMEAVRLVRKELPALISQIIADTERAKLGWKGYMVVDPETDNYCYSTPYFKRSEAEKKLKDLDIKGLVVIEVDITPPPQETDKK